MAKTIDLLNVLDDQTLNEFMQSFYDSLQSAIQPDLKAQLKKR